MPPRVSPAAVEDERDAEGRSARFAPGWWIAPGALAGAVPRALLPRRAAAKRGIAYDTAPDELKPTLLAIARLEHAARERRRAKEDGKEMRG